MEKRTRTENHFDNPNPNLLLRKDMPGDMERIAERDQREVHDRYRADERKQVFDYIREHPGSTVTEILRGAGSKAPLKEWLRDGLIVKRGTGHYLA